MKRYGLIMYILLTLQIKKSEAIEYINHKAVLDNGF